MYRSLVPGIMKKISILFLIGIMVFISGCTKTEKNPDIVLAYSTVIDKLYSEDSGLNGDIKYLAIDTSHMVNLTDKTKAELLKELDKYGFIVLNMTFKDLKSQGYIKDLVFKKGILFQIEDEPFKNNCIKMKASKWRSGLGAIGYNKITVEYKEGKWQITELTGMWIS